MEEEEARKPAGRCPSLGWWIVLIVTIGAIVGCGDLYVRAHRAEAFFRSLSIPAYPKAIGLVDRVDGGGRGIVFRAPATYPQQDALDFYKRSLTASEGWRPAPRRSDNAGRWVERPTPLFTTVVGGMPSHRREPSVPEWQSYYTWKNPGKGISAKLYVTQPVHAQAKDRQSVMLTVQRSDRPQMGLLATLMMLGTRGLRLIVGLFILGAIGGSAINAVVGRIKKRERLLGWPECPGCGARRQLIELVPIVGWLVSLGRCRTSGERIGVREPVVAALGGFIALGALMGGGRYYVAPVLTYVACAALLVAIVVELDRVAAPGKVYWTVGGAAALIDAWHIVRVGSRWMLSCAFPHSAQMIVVMLPRCVVGAAIGAAAMLALAALAWVVSKHWGLLGDVKVAAAVGALMATVGYSPRWPMVALAAGVVIGFFMWIARRGPEGRPRYLPMAMAVAALITVLAPAVLSISPPMLMGSLLLGV